jgi:hypothetical protein
MALPLIAAGLGAASSVQKLIQGMIDNKKSKEALRKFENLQDTRPEYSIPEEVLEMLTLATQAYGDPMPGQTDMLDRNTLTMNNALQAGIQGGDPFAAIGAAQGRADRSNLEVGFEAERRMDDQRRMLMSMLEKVGQGRDMEWQMNEFAPWKDDSQFQLNEYRDYRQAGRNNVNSGIDGIGSVASAFLTGGFGGGVDEMALEDIWSDLMGPNLGGMQQGLGGTGNQILGGIGMMSDPGMGINSGNRRAGGTGIGGGQPELMDALQYLIDSL